MPDKNQIKAIGILRRKVFANNDQYYDALWSNYGVTSCKELTERDARRFIAQMHQLNGDARQGNKYKGQGVRGKQARLTNEQAERIGILQSLLGWSDAGLLKFIARQLRKPTGVEMLRNWEAVKVIVGMQRVLSSNIGIEYKELNETNNTDLIENYKSYKQINTTTYKEIKRAK